MYKGVSGLLTEIKFFLYRLTAMLIAFLEFCVPCIGKKFCFVDPASGSVSVISKGAWAPRVFANTDGTLLAGYEKEGKIFTAISTDGGQTWQNHTLAALIDGLSCANINFYKIGDTVYLAYRATGTLPDGSFYSSLRVSQSCNGGLSWSVHSLICENSEPDGRFKGVWEPFLYEINGRLVCFYANDSSCITDYYQNIEMRSFDGESWSTPATVSDGKAHDSRDGMPVLHRLSCGKYVLAIESTKYREDYPFVIQILYSCDGINWSEPRDAYIPSTKGSKAGAPGISETADGRLIITFQTDEDKDEKGDGVSVAKMITAKTHMLCLINPGCFSKAQSVFPEEYSSYSNWGGIYSDGNFAYYAAGTSSGAVLNKIPLQKAN